MAGNRYVQALDLSPGFSDFGDRQSMCWGSGVNRMIERGLWGGHDMMSVNINNVKNNGYYKNQNDVGRD